MWHNICVSFNIFYMSERSLRVFQRGPEDILIRREEGEKRKKDEDEAKKKEKASGTVWADPKFFDETGKPRPGALEEWRRGGDKVVDVKEVEADTTVETKAETGARVISLQDYRARMAKGEKQGNPKLAKGNPRRLRHRATSSLREHAKR